MGYGMLIIKELVRACEPQHYNPEALGFWGTFGDGDSVEIELTDGTFVRVSGPETVKALQQLATGSSLELVRATLLSRREGDPLPTQQNGKV